MYFQLLIFFLYTIADMVHFIVNIVLIPIRRDSAKAMAISSAKNSKFNSVLL